MGAPPVLSNFEAMKWFMKEFAPTAAQELGQELKRKLFAQSISPTWPAGKQVQVDHHAEDKYALKEVLPEALEIVEDSALSLYRIISS
jgi:hypothetical protein